MLALKQRDDTEYPPTPVVSELVLFVPDVESPSALDEDAVLRIVETAKRRLVCTSTVHHLDHRLFVEPMNWKHTGRITAALVFDAEFEPTNIVRSIVGHFSDPIDRASPDDSQSETLSLLNRIRELPSRDAAVFGQAKSDALKFVAKLPKEITSPMISVAEDGEVVFEWVNKDHHAVVDFEGDEIFGYALLNEGRFVPGKDKGELSRQAIPNDLADYLQRFFKR